jgi:DNA polymerase-4
MTRKILHLDLDAFFCAVEEKFDPSLKGKPFATGGSPDGRGVVTSCSYAARQHGIHSAMPMKQALRKFPGLITVHGHYSEYSKHSRLVMAIIRNLTPLVEQISIDEAFLDVTDLPEAPQRIASDLQMKIYSELDLPCSIGAATNKLVAKIANNIGKKQKKGNFAPMAISVIEPGKEMEFLAPLPVDEMWGIGPKSATELNQIGIKTIGDILNIPREKLIKRFGIFADDLIRRSKGLDNRPVAEYEGVKSISNEITFFQDKGDPNELYTTLRHLSEKVGFRLRKKQLSGKTVKIKIRWPDFETHTHQITLTQPTNQDSVIFEAAKQLFNNLWSPGKKVRLIGVGVSQIEDEYYQLELFDNSFQKEKELLRAIDQLHEKFGEKSIQKGVKPESFRSWKE